MAKHYEWPKSCLYCPLCNGFDEVGFLCAADVGSRPKSTLECPLIVRDEDGLIEWEANGWPEPSPFLGDYSNMPDDVQHEWLDICCDLEDAYMRG